jgi:hypothetical protein
MFTSPPRRRRAASDQYTSSFDCISCLKRRAYHLPASPASCLSLLTSEIRTAAASCWTLFRNPMKIVLGPGAVICPFQNSSGEADVLSTRLTGPNFSATANERVYFAIIVSSGCGGGNTSASTSASGSGSSGGTTPAPAPSASISPTSLTFPIENTNTNSFRAKIFDTWKDRGPKSREL